MPIAQKQIITSVPALGMQFANDCHWLAAQMLSLARSVEVGSVDPKQTSASMLSFAKNERQRQIVGFWPFQSANMDFALMGNDRTCNGLLCESRLKKRDVSWMWQLLTDILSAREPCDKFDILLSVWLTSGRLVPSPNPLPVGHT